MVSGMMPARKIQRHNVTIGLGTDVSGGYSPSMLQTIRLTLHNSATLQHCNGGPEENGPVMKWQEGFFLATQGMTFDWRSPAFFFFFVKMLTRTLFIQAVLMLLALERRLAALCRERLLTL
jgi:hypothetical protein